ncbi:DNA polymerase IV [Deinococcus sp. RM]|uniref:DNA polymerase IV n=1 Tax=Deinococcus sp. RM TaxID=2316359 RepID=UPI000E67FF60|nr:DNA polymerase IV [Deinococcus sp. RM]RIX96738.1 DNA polymerase IV [Deinococcus sp. RM]
MRKVVHVDADAFFASVELRDDPSLRGKAVAVAYHGPRSVVTTATYEARQFGVRSALPLKTALARCPHLIVIEPRMDAYREASRIIQGVFHEFTDLVEPLSLDEAYLDLTEPKRGPRSATLIAQEIRRLVRDRTGGLTVSAGVSYNKLLAKLGSGMNKPDGLTVILPDDADALLARLPVGDFYGIGPVTAGKLERMGIKTGADLRARSLPELTSAFGSHGAHMYAIARGLDERPVDPSDDRKSVGTEDTYDTDLRTLPEMLEKLPDLSERTSRRLTRHGLAGQVVTVKVKFANFDLVTRQQRLPAPVQDPEEIERVARYLLTADLIGGRAVRLLGVSVSALVDPQGRNVAVPLFRLV